MISLYNTKGRKKEVFAPIKEGEVSMYHCGPTVYHYAHIGNLRSYVLADTLRRMFEYQGYTVRQVINITDVGHLVSDENEGQDKMEKGAAREGKTVWEVAKYYEDAFHDDLAKMNINTANTTFPKATGYIKEQIELIQTLEEKGFTYRISDGIYFDTSKFDRYADFARLDLAGMRDGARVEKNDEKRNPSDFALWKFSPKNEQRQMEWDSPWGIGFPGWHIECSAMSMKLLGETFDIHTGGIDHIPVHHTNEIAQSECATGETYVHYWMHNNFLQMSGGKMAKSGESFIRLSTLIENGITPLSYRYWLLMAHYRSSIDFSIESVQAAQKGLEKLYREFDALPETAGTVNEAYKMKFVEAISDDLNTPQALAIVFEMLKDTAVLPEDKRATLLDFDRVLGLELGNREKIKVLVPDEVQALAKEREQARIEKNWQRSDELRMEIEKLGFTVLDSKDGGKIVPR